MHRIDDALELLTAQHDEIDRLIAMLSTSGHPERRTHARAELAEKIPLHLALEQELFYPTMSGVIAPDVLGELVAEHAEIKRILAELVWSELDDDALDRELAALHDVFDVHRAWQEAQLFETVAEAHDPLELAALGHEMNAWVDRLAPSS